MLSRNRLLSAELYWYLAKMWSNIFCWYITKYDNCLVVFYLTSVRFQGCNKIFAKDFPYTCYWSNIFHTVMKMSDWDILVNKRNGYFDGTVLEIFLPLVLRNSCWGEVNIFCCLQVALNINLPSNTSAYDSSVH